jgi:hypothetical protein
MFFESHDSAVLFGHVPKCASRTVIAWMVLCEYPRLFDIHPEWFRSSETRICEYGNFRRLIRHAAMAGNKHHYDDGILPEMKYPIRMAVVRDPVSRFTSAYRNRVLYHKVVGDSFGDISTLPQFIEKFDDIQKVNTDVKTHFRPMWSFLGREPSAFTHIYTTETLSELKLGLETRYKVKLPDLHLQQCGTVPQITASDEDKSWILERYAEDANLWKGWSEAAETKHDLSTWVNPMSSQRCVRDGQAVVLVGNGPSLLDGNLGKVIDSFDVVVRFNAFKIKGFEQSVGTKTSMWSTHGGTTALPDETESPKRGILVYETAESGLPLEEVWRVPLSFWRGVRDRVRRESKKENKDKINPTSGIVVALWLLEQQGAMQIHLAGYDHFRKNRSNRHHYWLPKAYGRPSELDGDAEASVLSHYVNSGRVFYIS